MGTKNTDDKRFYICRFRKISERGSNSAVALKKDLKVGL